MTATRSPSQLHERLTRWADAQAPKPSTQLQQFMGPVTPPRTIARTTPSPATRGPRVLGLRVPGLRVPGLRSAGPGLTAAFAAAFVSMTTIAVAGIAYSTVGLPPGLRPVPSRSTPMITARVGGSSDTGAEAPTSTGGQPGGTTGTSVTANPPVSPSQVAGPGHPTARPDDRHGGAGGSRPAGHDGRTAAADDDPAETTTAVPSELSDADEPGTSSGSDTGADPDGSDSP